MRKCQALLLNYFHHGGLDKLSHDRLVKNKTKPNEQKPTTPTPLQHTPQGGSPAVVFLILLLERAH